MLYRLTRATRARLFVLVALALVVRALVPTGWMTVATAHGVRLEICEGQSPLSVTAPMAGMHHGGKDHGKAAMPDHPCTFAGIGLAADTAPPIAIAPPPGHPPEARLVRVLTAAIGRGLAAPPPPATGPPAFA